ncbi:MAG: zeta toxin family protein [Clostridia bacterium]|nr:zeta toxin family protein [Clostridia bacterium]
MKQFVIYAGINGAGKSTLYNFQNKRIKNFVNLDLIVRELGGDWNVSRDYVPAVKEAKIRLNDSFETQKSLAYETTLVSNNLIRYIERAKTLGYKVTFNFIGVPSLEQSIERIKERVEQGGHNVLQAVVEHRFLNQFSRIQEVVKMVDEAYFYDNSEAMVIVGVFEKNKLLYNENEIPWVKKMFLENPELPKNIDEEQKQIKTAKKNGE